MKLKKTAWFIIFKLLLSYGLAGQNNRLYGILIDSTTDHPIVDVAIAVLSQKDSILLATTRSDSLGGFSFRYPYKGDLLLLFSHPDYVDFVQAFSDITTVSLDTLKLMQKIKMMDNVTIKGYLSNMKVKGDTIEYNTDSIQLPKNANAEELLKQLSGFQIDQHGNITVYGKAVRSVLVDGEEFFSTDPVLVTRTLRSDMISAVQVYDKKSDQALFSGIDDGVKNRTINLKLKEDKKRGYFGKFDAGKGDKNYYGIQGALNSFNDKRKAAIYITSGNNGRVGFSGDETSRFGIDETNNATYDGIGIPTVTNGGAHYNNSWNQKHYINSDYYLNKRQNFTEYNAEGLSVTPGNNITGKTTAKHIDKSFLNKSVTNYEFRGDSTLITKIYVEGSIRDNRSDAHSEAGNFREDSSLINSSSSKSENETRRTIFSTNASIQKKFTKPRRTASLYVSEFYQEDLGTNNLTSNNNFYNNSSGIIDSVFNLNQVKKTNKEYTQQLFVFNYSEPVSKKVTLNTGYTFFSSSDNSIFSTYNTDSLVNNLELDSLFSNSFKYNRNKNIVTLGANYSAGKFRMNFKGDLELLHMNQKNFFTSRIFDRSFTNFFGNINATYDFKQGQYVVIEYNGESRSPQISQLQPILNNVDPLNIVQGNTGLTPSFYHNFSVKYNKYDYKNERYFNVSGNYNFLRNPIIDILNIDYSYASSFRSYTNLDRTPSQYSFNFYLDHPLIKSQKFYFTLTGQIQGGEGYGIVNEVLNKTSSTSYGGSFGIRQSKNLKYDISLSNSLNYSKYSATINPSLDNDRWSYFLYNSINIYPTKRIRLTSDFSYSWYENANINGDAFRRVLWNCAYSHKLFKSENFSVRFSINDIFNQNKGIDIGTQNNLFYVNRFNTIGRNIMISLIWDFSKFGKKRPEK